MADDTGRREYHRRYRAEHRDAILANQRRWREKNREAIRAKARAQKRDPEAKQRYNRKYQAEHREQLREKRLAKYAADPAGAAARLRAWRIANRAQARQWNRAHYRRNREKRIAATRRWQAANYERYRALPSRSNEAKRAVYARSLERNRRNKRLTELRRRARKASALHVAFTQEQLAQRLSMYAGCWM